ncbi:bifunctional DNA-formamidopyrimidine glycosylase/DNA-(apurinic or apyrimidinic site) lyase [Rhodocyclaceae bacterium SMB388]
MPELPEVETTRRGILPVLTGRIVTGCRVRNPRLRLPVCDLMESRVTGRKLLDVGRRAKYLLLIFDAGCVIVHLGMSGSLRVVPADLPPGPHDHVDLVFGASALRLRDPRRFGLIVWHDGDALAHPLLRHLGPEPLEAGFDAGWLYRATRATQVPIKQALMDGRRVVGVGNIYASESLFRACINPLVSARTLGRVRCARLVGCVRETLQDAIVAGGSTLRDFVGGDGRPGYFQQQYFVYGRAGQACRVCGQAIVKATVAQRATFWCPHCQRR